MAEGVHQGDAATLKSLVELTPLFTHAVKRKLEAQGKIPDLVKASTPGEIQQQQQFGRMLSFRDMALTDKTVSEDDMRQFAAEFDYMEVCIHEIFSRAAARVSTVEELSKMMPPVMATEQMAGTLERYKLSTLAQIIRKAMP